MIESSSNSSVGWTSEIVILGCGPSSGVPTLTQHWGQCNANQIKNRRTRCSLAWSLHPPPFPDEQRTPSTWLMDTSPDLYLQCQREGLHHIDGVLYTHAHYDHMGGLDELKIFSLQHQKPMAIWLDQTTLDSVETRYPYALPPKEPRKDAFDPSFLNPHLIVAGQAFSMGHNGRIIPFSQNHRYSLSMGYKFPQWAYSTDVWELDDHAFEILKNVPLWIVGCLARHAPGASHANLETVLQWIERVSPQQAVLTHMGRDLDYDTLCQELPPHIRPAYDGMRIQIHEFGINFI